MKERVRALSAAIAAWAEHRFREGWNRASGAVTALRRRRLSWSGSERPRYFITSVTLGGVLVGISYSIYVATASPPKPPIVEGAGELYTDRPEVAASVAVSFSPTGVRAGRSQVQIDIIFLEQKAKPVKWALVLYGDAAFADPHDPGTTVIPPGAEIVPAWAGDPPFAANPRKKVQIISGTTYPANLKGQVGVASISGWVPVAVVSRSRAIFTLALPRYGRVHLSPLFDFPKKPGAIDIGIPGRWQRPDRFQVNVNAGRNPAGYRIDLASPDVADPTKLSWESSESIRAVLRRTDLDEEAKQQTINFLLGAVVGAGASSVVVALENLVKSLRWTVTTG
ncbi:hypothetical protein [Sphaerisporangium corydalis]|uniref:Uncharacterized protein n=1 Tax=Sphaerisporangium corydalis TaxID=1441875 RepID=A0ABV9E6U1_9ACTN|nr:hypothetical protein [Sphaerisporangium corydalis]